MENLVLALFFIVLWVVLYNLIQGALDKRKQKCSCGTPYRPEDVVGEDVAEAFGTFGTRKLRVKVRCAACGKIRTFDLNVRRWYDAARGESVFPTARQYYENLRR